MYRLATSLQKKVKKGIPVTSNILNRYLIDHGISIAEFSKKNRA